MILEHKVIEDCLAQIKSGKNVIIIPERSFGTGFWAKVKQMEKELYIGVPGFEAARCYTKTIFEETGGFEENMHAGEDFTLHYEALKNNGIIGRTQHYILHNEGHPSLIGFIRKWRYYAKNANQYSKKMNSLKVNPPSLPSLVWKNSKKLIQKPIIFCGLVILKIIEYVVIGFHMRKNIKRI